MIEEPQRRRWAEHVWKKKDEKQAVSASRARGESKFFLSGSQDIPAEVLVFDRIGELAIAVVRVYALLFGL